MSRLSCCALPLSSDWTTTGPISVSESPMIALVVKEAQQPACICSTAPEVGRTTTAVSTSGEALVPLPLIEEQAPSAATATATAATRW
jgi:hypothetical protein